jgi:hypothetical protein
MRVPMIAKEKPATTGIEAGSRTAFDGEIVAEFGKNSRQVYRIVRHSFKGVPLVDIRVWFADATTGELRPGKGLSLKLEVLPEIVATLAALIEVEGGELP